MATLVRALIVFALGFTLGAAALATAGPAVLERLGGAVPGAVGATPSGAPVGELVATPVPTVALATPVPSPTPLPAPRALYDEELIVGLYERAAPSVVLVSVRVSSGVPAPREGTGSGFLIDTDGHILTNQHVVRGADRVEVGRQDGARYPATVVGEDPLNDVALLRIEAPGVELRPLPLGESSKLKVGQLVVAIGNPLGYQRTLTVGVVGGIGRVLEESGRRPLVDLIQTDAAINPGNSGGPLLNARGEVVGINTLVDRSQPGIGFAVPIDTARRLLPALFQGRVRHPWLGISGGSVTGLLADQLGLSVRAGVLVNETVAGGPAARAGRRGASAGWAGDVIVAIDGRPVARMADIVASLDTRQVGDTVELTIVRDGQPLAFAVELGEYPE